MNRPYEPLQRTTLRVAAERHVERTEQPMITRDEMPDDNADLAKVAIDFPRLDDDTELSCPVPLDEVVGYLRLESADYEKVTEEQLTFLRTAEVSGVRYWIWAFRESDGSDCYATVSLDPEGKACTSYDQNDYDLTPEQFMLGDFHGVF